MRREEKEMSAVRHSKKPSKRTLKSGKKIAPSRKKTGIKNGTTPGTNSFKNRSTEKNMSGEQKKNNGKNRQRAARQEKSMKDIQSRKKRSPKLQGKRKVATGKKKQRVFRNVRARIFELGVIVLSTALIFLIASSIFLKTAKVSGFSMLPTLRAENTVLVKKTKTFHRFDLVLFKRGEIEEVRRVIGLPGEQITYSEDFLYVDGEPIDEKFIIDEINEAQKNGGQYTEDFQLQDISSETVIPENHYLVLGDNRDYGYDSRDYGLIDSRQIIGIVTMRLLPLNDLTAF
ncbi:signal peptidase I [Enterococcus larvae]|uniref:signal peptidase I n=1 Tax=Enterococcus larvae TaxID=2794352 RepID=UPI003F2DABAE